MRSRMSRVMARTRTRTPRSACTTAWAASRSSAGVASSPSKDPNGCSIRVESPSDTTGDKSHGLSSAGGLGSSTGPLMETVVETLPNGCGRFAARLVLSP